LLLLGLLLGAACIDTSRTRLLPELSPGKVPSDQLEVVLAAGRDAPFIRCSGPWVALGPDGRERARGSELADTNPAGVTASEVRISGRSLGPPPIELRSTGSARLSVDGKPYRGSLLIKLGSEGTVRVINSVSVEDYLLGVVAAEMPQRFGLEALKAQAVAARSYALATASGPGRLYADTRSQMYGGLRSETPLSTRAVRETRAQILSAGIGPLTAWYHSTCGGRTTPARLIFPGAQSGVMDREVICSDCRNAPLFSWTRRVAGEFVCDAMGLPRGPLDMVGVGTSALPGRPERLFVRSGAKSTTVNMVSLRQRLSAGLPLAQQVPSTRLASAPSVVDGELVLTGHGWGHGVGMCQYGAAGFAARGADYRAILRRYYPGANLTRLP
jgi:stage II sporulation protein D